MGARTDTDPVVQVLGRIPLFQGLPRADLERIAKLVQPRELRQGEFLFREGDEGDRCYIVEEGAVEVLKERPLGDHDQLAMKRRGEAFGELSLLDPAPRAASVRAVEDARLLTISRSDFDGLLGGDSFNVRLLRGLSRSLRALDVRFVVRDSGAAAGSLRQFGHLVLQGLEPRAAPVTDGYTLAGGCAREDGAAGESFWDAFTTEDDRALLALMNVKGSGLPPAYLIAIIRALFRELGSDVPFEDLLRRLNGATFGTLFEGLDECVEAALIEIRDGAVHWSCAGDEPAVILGADGSSRTVSGHGPPLGILPHFDYGVTSLELEPGETLLAFSDAPAGLVKGAVDLIQAHPDTEPVQLARLLQVALQNVQTPGSEIDVSFVVVRRGNASEARG